MQKVVLALCLVVGLCVTAFAQSEVLCNDGVDNDGDGKIDCNDGDCQFVVTVEKGCRCYDNIDNDGDGKIDKADGDCASYYGLTFVGQGSNCSITPPGSQTPFTGMSPPIVSGQNTSDTQSKVAVGDVDGDGYPDAVITSKWNSQIRVVSTGNFSGYASGDIKSDFKTTGQGAAIFPSAPKNTACDLQNLLFEHEVVIADIDHVKATDGKYKSEIFAVVSNRLGNPESPPTCFFLIGFRVPVLTGKTVDLEVLPGYPVKIGTDRPGILGVADFDGDGKSEVYLKNRIYAAENGALLADGGGNWDSEINSGPVAANIGGDSKLELICGNYIYSVPSLSSRTTQSMTLFADMNTSSATKYYPRVYDDVVEYGLDNHSSSSVADIDEDGTIDVLMTGSTIKYPAAQNTTIFYWNVKKNKVSTYAPPDPTYASGWPWGTGRINIGDSDGDGNNEATFMAGSLIFNMEFDSLQNREVLMPTAKWTRTVNDSRSGVLSVTIYDFNNDAKPEMVYRDSQELVVIDGKTGQNKQWSAVCQSHTYTEGPIIADVNGDGGTDICVPCYRNATAFSINGGLQQQALGEVRLFFSSTNSWLPTRKVWNQPGYFVVNINDDLTVPRSQMDQSTVFGTAACPNGLPGPQMPLNIYLNQVPHLSASGCPVFPAPDLTYVGDQPNPTGTDTNGDGVYTPAVVVIPPICGDLGIQVYFNILNNGELPISDNVPVSFFNGDPTVSPVTAVKLKDTVIAINNLQVGQTLVTPKVHFNGPGTTFKLFIVLYNNGSILPISLAGQSTKECTIANNIYSVDVAPDPFTVTVEKLTDNQKCGAGAADVGSIRAHIFKGGVEVTDYSPFAFQWYTGAGTTSPIAAPTGTAYNLLGRAAGDYTVVVTNTQKGCKGVPVTGTIAQTVIDPTINITVVSNQTQCSPANGKLQADIVGGNTGYTFDWYDISLVPLGISGPVASNLVAGNYVVLVGKSGCTKTSSPATVLGPQIPDADATVLQNVIDCSDPNSGSITANALFNGVIQPAANYTFTWYFYDNPTSTRGSILPPANGTGPTRTLLPVGFYQVEIKENATQCISGQSPVRQITSQAVIPDPPVITQLSPQTSCDPSKPNGILTADVTIGGVAQNPAGFTFEWFKGQNTLAANLVTTVSDVNGKTVNQVSGGGTPYTVKVTTPNHCSSTNDFTIGEDVQVPIVTLAQLTPNSICDPAKATSTYSGSLQASVTFNAAAVTLPDPNYVFTWRDASNVVIPVADNKNPVLTGLKEGNYFVSVTRTDLFCNSVPDAEPVIKATILPLIKTDSIPSTSCNASFKNGQVSVKTIDGLLPSATTNYLYQWQDNANANIAGATASVLTGLQGGLNYTIHITNKTSGCENTHTIPLPDAHVVPAVSLVVVSPNSVCDATIASNPYNGKIQSNFTQLSGNAADYQYEWRNVTAGNTLIGTTPPAQAGLTSNQFGGLNGNITYSVVAKNTVLGCNSAPAQVLLPNAPLLPVIKMDSVASTNCDPLKPNGSVSVKTVDALLPSATTNYLYKWTDSGATPTVAGQTNSQVVNVNGGFNYTIEITNKQTGCKNTHVTPLPDVHTFPSVQLVVVQPNSICDVAKGYNGELQANLTTTVGNAIDYQYTWKNVTAGNTLVGTTPPAQAGLTANQFGGLNGGITYSVIAMNTVLGCSGVSQVLLPNAQLLPVIKMDSVASTNCDPLKPNGSVSVKTVDGFLPTATTNYLYKWTDSGATPTVVGQTGSSVVNVNGGFNYTIEITNNTTGCKNTHVTPLPDVHVFPAVQLVVVQPNSICDVAKGFNGEIQSNFTTLVGNAADYQYTWKNVTAGNTLVGTTPPAQAGLTANQFGGLNGGITYSVTALNTVLGCPGVSQVLLPNAQLLPVIKMDSVASTNCDPLKPNGAVLVKTVDGLIPTATTNYLYKWSDNGSTTPVSAQTGAQVLTVNGGFNYTVEVTNNTTGCKDTHTTPLPDKKVFPVVQAVVVTPNSICDVAKGFNGVIQSNFTTLVGNAADYSYTWNNVTTPAVVGTTPPAQAGLLVNQFGGLNGNITYSVAATNTVLGCTSGASQIFLPNAQLLPVIKMDSVASTNCDVLKPNGSVSVKTVDGLLPSATTNYTYAWTDNGATPSVSGQTGNQVLTVNGGFQYTIEITNSTTGCKNTHITPLPDKKVIPVMSLVVVSPNGVCDPLNATSPYSGKVQASFTVNSGNLADYTYTWRDVTNNTTKGTTPPIQVGPTVFDFGQLNGNITYGVTAFNSVLGCTSAEAPVFVPNSFILPVIKTDSIPSTNCDPTKSNGKVSVTTVDGVAPGSTVNYKYAWSDNGSSTPVAGLTVDNISNLQGGFDYTVKITNKTTGCANTHAITLTEDKQLPVIALTKVKDNQTCDPILGSSGEINATVTDRGAVQNAVIGTLPAKYVITWNTAATGEKLTSLVAGSYSASVTDTSLGCVSNPDSETIVDSFNYPAIAIPTPTDQTSCITASPNGAVQATITDAAAPPPPAGSTFTYTWHQGVGVAGASLATAATQPVGTVTVLSNRASDDYSIFVRNEITGCESVKSAFVPNNITYPTVTLANTNQVTICRPTPDGEAQATLTGLLDPAGPATISYDLFYAYTFEGGTYPTDAATIKAAADAKNISGGSAAVPPLYNDMAPGYLSALLVDKNTGCESNPANVQIIDATLQNQISVAGTSKAGFCGGLGGGVDITVTGGSTPPAQTYEWYFGTPSNNNINFFTNPPNMTSALLVQNGSVTGGVGAGQPEDLGAPTIAAGVGSGTYTVVITDAKGCGAYFVQNVPFLNPPQFDVTTTPVTTCTPPFNGVVTVNITSGASVFGYEIAIFKGNGPNPADSLSGSSPPVTAHFVANLDKGQYFVRVTDQNPVNKPCPLGQGVTVDQAAFKPVVAVGTILPNTSCDPDNSGSGSVVLNARPDDNQIGAVDFQVTNIVSNTPSVPGPVGFVPNLDIPDNGTDSGPIPGFGNGAYTVTVTDMLSGCATDIVANIPDQPVLPQIFTVASLDDSYCAPLSNGKIEVTAVGPGTIPDYHYEWYTSSDVSNPANLVYEDDGGGGTTGELFNGTKVPGWSAGVPTGKGWSFGATAGAGNGNRAYYVRARRVAGVSGLGCYTQLEQRIILDAHKAPDITLTAFANTSCIPGTREGVIRATTDITADPLDANVRNTGTYTYTWNPDPAGGNVSPVAGIARAANFDITDLDENGGAAYTVTSTNSVNGCKISSTATVPTQKIPISLISYSTLNQLICAADGEARVTEVKIDATNTANPAVFSFATPATLQAGFDFQWFSANAGDPSTFNAGAPLEFTPGNDITDVVLTDDGTVTAQPFPTMGAGTYYVIAKRKPGLSPGAGCLTSPTRITIEDKHINPEVVSIVGYSNTSCSPLVTEGRIEVKVKTASGVPAESGSTYSYTWTQANVAGNPTGSGTDNNVANGTATTLYTIPPSFPLPPAAPGPGQALKEDDYTVTIKNDYSGCTTTAQSTILPDRFPLTLISYTKQDQLICAPDGNITVTEVEIDASSSNLGVFNYNSAALIGANFDLSWFQAAPATPGTFNPATPLKDGLGGTITNVTLTEGAAAQQFPTMGEGTYYVIATRKTGMSPGAGCATAPTRVDLIKQVNMPQITSIEGFANTSCDANVTEGRIELQVNTTSGVPAESGSTYSYTWTQANVAGNPLGAGNDNNVANATATTLYTIPPSYTPPPAVPAPGSALKDDTYTIVVTNDYSGCTTTTSSVVTPAKYPLTLVSYTSQNQLICAPDGQITVTDVSIDGSTSNLGVFDYNTPALIGANFNLTWFQAPAGNPGTFNPATPLLDATSATITDVTLSEDATQTTQPFPTMGEGTYYVIATRKPGMTPGAGCATAPTRIDLIKQVNTPAVTSIEGFANTSCDANVTEGRIELQVNTTSGVPAESGSTYSYVWTQGDPVGNPLGAGTDNNVANATATTLYTIPPTYTPPPAVPAPGSALKEDTYNITITNDYSGCTTATQAIISPTRYPLTLISFTSQNQLICAPDGRITVTEVTIDGSTSNLGVFNYNTPALLGANFDISWFQAPVGNPATFNPATPLQDATATNITDVTLSDDATQTTQPFPTMGEGTYYVIATRKPGMTPGAGCATAPVRADILKQVNTPQVTSIEGFANTSCDANVTEGRIEVKVNTTSGVPAESGSTYSYVWTQGDPVGNPLGAGTDNNVANATATTLYTIPPTYTPPPAVPVPGSALKEDTYNITIKNDYSGCTTATQAIISPTRYPLTLISFTSQNQLICAPDGRITVTEVTIDGSTSNLGVFNYNTPALLSANFDLSWFQAPANDPTTFNPATPLTDALSNPITDPTLSEDPTQTTQPFVAMGEGSYYVIATRKPGMTPGAGCATAPVRVNIEKQVNAPIITSLQAFNNTSCESTVDEGRIELAVSTSSSVPAESGSTYSYTWTQADVVNNPGGAGALPTTGSSLTIPQNFPTSGLKDDTYTILVQNDYSLCTTTQQAVVSSSKLPITLISYLTEDQLICNPDGKITVTKVSIDATQSGLGVFTYNTPALLAANFDLKWFKALSGDPTAFDAAQPLLDATNTVITDHVLTEDAAFTTQPYPTMGAGTYYVTGTRKSGLSPGAGCTTTPVRIDIRDLSANPEISFASKANSACNPAKSNGSITATAKELDGSIGTYTYAWQFNSAPNPTVTNTIVNAQDGNYNLKVVNTATGCSFASDYTLILDLMMSTPNIIDVATVDPLDCKPSGSAEVTKISLGSIFSSTLFPPNIPPNNTITGPALATFSYEWYQGAYDPASLVAGQTAPLLPNLSPGTYYVAVQDPSTDCKSGPKEVVINDDLIVYPVARILQTAKQISCTATGTAALMSLGDGQDDTNPNYTFEWYPSLDLSGTRFATTSAINNLNIGDYSVNITNLVTGCSSSTLYTIPDEAPLFKPEVSSGGYPRTLCVGEDGTVTARVTNLSPSYPFPYNFTADLYIGATPDLTKAPDYPAMPAVPGFLANFQETALAEGSYTVRVTDNNTGCIGVAQADVIDNRELPNIVIVQDNPLTNCDPTRANGQLAATADGGKIGGYSFAWYTGTTVSTPPGTVLTTNDKLIAKGAGSYVVRVVNDLTGCQSDLSGNIIDSTVKPPVPDPKVVFDRTNCITPNGWVTVTVGGIVFNYTFNWYDGSAVKASSDFTGENYENLDIGPYAVTATDDVTGCVSPPAIVNVADKRVTPEFEISSTPSYCSDTGKPKGAGSISFELTTPDVVLDNAVWTNVETGATAGTGPAVYDLFPGQYHVVVTSTEGCVNEGQGEVKTEIAPYNGISQNGDGQNDFFIIDCITNFPFNNVKIFNRSGILVYEANGYNNNEVSFKGIGEMGVYMAGVRLPSGTYFYIIDKRDGSKPTAGYLELDR